MKPPYKVPSMKEIEQIPYNGYNVVSTFSGCGGSCLGYRMAGYKVVYANEFIPAAQEVYKLNHPEAYLDTRDIRKVKPEEILQIIGLKKGEVDLLNGSPPCAAFSSCGMREEGWGTVKNYSDTTQRVDDLFFEFTRLLDGLKPKVFIAENVKGLITGKAKGYFKLILKDLKDKGYSVKAQVLNAAYLGVPQARERLIYIGIRNDLNLNPVFPRPLKYVYSVKDAFNTPVNKSNEYYSLSGKSLKLYNYAISHNMTKFSEAYQALYGKSNMFCHYIINKNAPCYTIKQGATDIYHYSEPRSLTIPELKRICAFPDDFKLTGSFSQQWERLGRAVPPVMMYHISKTVKEEILDKIPC